MATRDWILFGFFMAAAGLTFLRLLAVERETAVAKAKAEAESTRRKKEALAASEIGVPSGDVEVLNSP